MEEFDALVIGSGAGGAPVAHTLARAGKRVLVLEKGPLLTPQAADGSRRSGFRRDELLATGAEKRIRLPGLANDGASYYSSHVEPDLNDEPHVYEDGPNVDRATLEGYTAQVVGGGTQLYGAVSLRFAPLDFRLRSHNETRTDLIGDPAGDVRREARDWPIRYGDLEAWYCVAEEAIGINGTRQNQLKPFSRDTYQPPLPPNPISSYVETGMDALHMQRYRTPLAVITRDHAPSGRRGPARDGDAAKTGYVNRYGDPLGFKSNTWVALLAPLAHLENLEVRCNCSVMALTAQGSTIDGVWYRDAGGRERHVSARLVIVACSAIESVRLLKLSALPDPAFAARVDPHGLLGKYFLTHCFGGAEGVMPGRFDKSISLDSDWATDHCSTEEFLLANGLWAGGAIYNNTSDQALPISLARTHGSQDIDTIWQGFVDATELTGARLAAFLDQNFGRRLSVSFMANQVPLRTNRIELHPHVTDKWGRRSAYIRKDWHAHDRHVMDVLAEQCGRILRFGGDGGLGQHPIEPPGGVYMAGNARARIANHILGGMRFGSDPADSVLDPLCRHWEFDNLYVTDGSFMPTSGGANPTLTIQANAFRVADHLLQRLT